VTFFMYTTLASEATSVVHDTPCAFSSIENGGFYITPPSHSTKIYHVANNKTIKMAIIVIRCDISQYFIS
jgi:hypothetical protein